MDCLFSTGGVDPPALLPRSNATHGGGTRDACASEQDSRGLQRRISDSFLEWSGEDLQLPGDRCSIPGSLLLVWWLQVLPGGRS